MSGQYSETPVLFLLGANFAEEMQLMKKYSELLMKEMEENEGKNYNCTRQPG